MLIEEGKEQLAGEKKIWNLLSKVYIRLIKIRCFPYYKYLSNVTSNSRFLNQDIAQDRPKNVTKKHHTSKRGG